METLATRLKSRRKELKMSQAKLAKRSGLSQTNICYLEIGRNAATKEILSVAKALECSPEWLMFGTEKKRPKQFTAEPIKETSEALHQPVFTYPLISMVQAGHWRNIHNPFEPGDGEEFISSFNCYGAGTFALRIVGESMLPEFRPGDIVIIDPTVKELPGDYVVAENGHEQAVFKKYRPRGYNNEGNIIFELVPLNEDYPTLKSDQDHLNIVGVMVEHHKFRKRP